MIPRVTHERERVMVYKVLTKRRESTKENSSAVLLICTQREYLAKHASRIRGCTPVTATSGNRVLVAIEKLADEESKDVRRRNGKEYRKWEEEDADGQARGLRNKDNTFKRFRPHKPPHLIRAIAACRWDNRMGNRRALIYPWADGGNLEDHLKSLKATDLHPEKGQWFVRQFAGICDGLKELRGEVPIYHYTLSPKRLLVFNEGKPTSTLRITGIEIGTSPDETKTKLGKETSHYNNNSQHEKTMEAERKQKEVQVSARARDVWCLGLIILGYIYWRSLGCDYDAWTDFQEDTSNLWCKPYRNPPYEVSGKLSPYFNIAELWSKKSSANASLWTVVKQRLLTTSPDETDISDLWEELDAVYQNFRNTQR